jgi:mono/diheme cytochrome c family protein
MAGVGPNLRDDNWLYGSDMLEMIETLQYGRPGGMPAQGSILSERDMIAVAAYLADWNRTAKANGQGYTKDGEKLLPIGY